jgi:hypothetical protein
MVQHAPPTKRQKPSASPTGNANFAADIPAPDAACSPRPPQCDTAAESSSSSSSAAAAAAAAPSLQTLEATGDGSGEQGAKGQLVDALQMSHPLPIVVQGAQRSWAAPKCWARLEYFAEAADAPTRERQVQVACSHDGKYSGAPLLRQSVHMRWGSFADSLLDPDEHEGLHFYLSQETLLRGRYFESATMGDEGVAASLFSADFAVPAFVPWAACGVSANLWLAAHATVSALHYDAYHNLLCVVRGRKTVTLYPPSAAAALQPGIIWGDAPHYAHAAGDNVPPTSSFDVTLDAGRCLFIPEGWWHRVASAPGTAALNIWWLSPYAIATLPNANTALSSCARPFHMRTTLLHLVEERIEAMVASVADLDNEISQVCGLGEIGSSAPHWQMLARCAEPARTMAQATPRVLRTVVLAWARDAAASQPYETPRVALRQWWVRVIAELPAPANATQSSRSCRGTTLSDLGTGSDCAQPVTSALKASEGGCGDDGSQRLAPTIVARAVAAWCIRRALELGAECSDEATLRAEVMNIHALDQALGEGWAEGLQCAANNLGRIACSVLLTELVGPWRD